MKKVVLSLIVWAILSAALPVAAAPVSVEKARRAATNFAKIMGAKERVWVDITAQTGFEGFYVFAGAGGRGFVLVSDDDNAVPILGWSATNVFSTEGMPVHLRQWLAQYEEQLRHLRQARPNGELTAAPADNPAGRWWQQLLSGSIPTGPSNTAVSPMINTHWDQQDYYNSHCPYDSTASERTMTGCIATSAGQLMRYWSHPDTSYGSHAYNHTTYGTQSANFATGYNWSLMPVQLTAGSSAAQIDAVATLMRHIGVAVEMNYGIAAAGGSGAQSVANGQLNTPSVENALRYYFKYRSSLHSIKKRDMSDSAWRAILRNELDNGRPVLYDGFDTTSGHSFLCDGYDSAGMFHFNWGWSGNADGYYYIGSLNPMGSSGYHSFNLRNTAIIGIEPNTGFGSNTVVTVGSSTSGYGSVSGSGTYSGVNSNVVTLTATATSGKRFVGWSDGYRFNPRSFYANGGNYSFTANFEALNGDTLGYCTGSQIGSVTISSGTCHWGIRLPASVLTPGHNMTSAMLYPIEAGNYTLTIYTGNSSPTNMVHTQNFTVSANEVGNWLSVPLSSPVHVNGNQSLWITFSCTGITRPVALTYYSGNNHSRLWGSSFMPNTSWNYSFMVRGVFSAPPVYEDTVAYCTSDSITMHLGANRNIWWGIRLPPAMHNHRDYLTDVMLYVDTAGSYEVKIYQGDSTTASTRVAQHTAVFGASAAHRWQLIHLPFPVTLNDSLPLWVTFHNTTARYPAVITTFSGDSNSSLMTRDGGITWKSINTASHGEINGSWLIRAVLSNMMVTPFNIDGPISVGQDIPATFTVNCPYTANWSWTVTGATVDTNVGSAVTALWDTTGDYLVILGAEYGGVTLGDTLHVEVHACNNSVYPFTTSFEVADDMSCWRIVDADNDGYTWAYTANDSSLALSGVRAFASTSRGGSTSSLPTDNWVISPTMELATGHYYRLMWHDRAIDAAHLSGHYSVYISTNGNHVEDFTGMPLFQTTLSSTNYTQRTLDLSSYAGQDISVAFRLHSTANRHGVIIDDVTLAEGSPRYYTLQVASSDTVMGYAAGGGSYASGTEATLAAVARHGYGFVRWDDNSIAAVRPVTVTTNKTYTAYFEQLTEFDTILVPDTVTVHDTTLLRDTITVVHTVHDTTLLYDTIIVGRLVHDTTYVHDTVLYHDTVTIDRYIHDTMWIQIAYHTLTVTSAERERGIAIGSGRYSDSTVVEIAALPVSGNRFVQWSDGSAENPRHVQVTDDMNLSATFEPDNTAVSTAEADGITITNSGHDITVQGAYGKQIRIFDVLGRVLATKHCEADFQTFRMPSAGVYLIQTGNHAAHRIVLR